MKPYVEDSNMLIYAIVALTAVLLSGCASRLVTSPLADFAREDIAVAQRIAEAGAPILPAGDPWAPCLSALTESLKPLHTALAIPGGGVLAEATRLHVLDSAVMNLPPDVRTHCGAMLFQLQMRAARRLPGF